MAPRLTLPLLITTARSKTHHHDHDHWSTDPERKKGSIVFRLSSLISDCEEIRNQSQEGRVRKEDSNKTRGSMCDVDPVAERQRKW